MTAGGETEPFVVPEAVDARRFELLASALAGRPLRVRWAAAGPTNTDGAVIDLDPRFADRARDAVIVQAVLLGGGALEPELVRSLRGRPRAAARHLAEQVPRCLAEIAALLPEDHGIGPAREEWWGELRPGRLLRAERSAGLPLDDPRDSADDLPVADPAANGDRPRRDDQEPGGTDDAGGGAGRRRWRRTRAVEAGAGTAALQLRRAKPGPGEPVHLVSSPDGPVLLDGPPGRSDKVATYPEWDAAAGAYRQGWCAVHTVGVTDRRSKEEPVLTDLAAVRREIATVRLDLQRVGREAEGEDFDLDAVVAHRLDAAAGQAGEARVHRATRRIRRDLGVVVLLDASASTERTSVGGRSTAAHQRDAALTLVTSFDSLGDRVACHAFRSHGRRRVEFSTVKGFDERCGTDVADRLHRIQPEGYTRLGAAIRHAGHLVRAGSGAQHWLLVVLSDGLAFDVGYEGDHALIDARRALLEERRAGVGALCLDFGARTTYPTRSVFGAATHLAAPSLAERRAELGSILRVALAAAAKSRRI